MILTWFIIVSNATGQNYRWIYKKVKRLELINKEFRSILDSLVKVEIKCGNYNPDKNFFWSIYFKKYNNNKEKYTDLIEVTFVSGFDDTAKIMGYFEINGVTFILWGEYIHPDFFLETGDTKVLKSKYSDPRPEDYSIWFYGYSNGQIYRGKSYQLPCDN